MSNVRSMKPCNVTSSWLKVLTCLAFAMALIFSAPPAAHATSGMGDGHHSGSVSSLPADTMDGGASNPHGEHENYSALTDDVTADSGKDKQTLQCCFGICISLIVLDDDKVFSKPVPATKYSVPDAQTRSVDKIGLLRPPRSLI